MEQTFCQSCGMPLTPESELCGTNADGSKNPEYCIYCYKGGAFTADVTLDEMIEICVPPMVEANPGMTAGKARELMRQFMPQLKRWR